MRRTEIDRIVREVEEEIDRVIREWRAARKPGFAGRRPGDGSIPLP